MELGAGRKRAYYAAHGTGLSFVQLCAELTALKKVLETAWLQEIDSQLLQQALRDLEQAFKYFISQPKSSNIVPEDPQVNLL